MRKSFTLIELVIVIVIIGILGTISTDIIRNSYIQYTRSKELNKLAFKTDLLLNLIASKLQNRIKNSVIVVECNVTADKNDPTSCLYDVNKNRNFKSINGVDENESNRYPVLEWLYISSYSHRGIWNKSVQYVKPGWSGFVDLKTTVKTGDDEYNISTPESNFTTVQYIDGNWSQNWQVSGFKDVFSNEIDTLVFSGSDGRGDLEDINNSYGYYYHKATRVFEIKDLIDDENLSIKAIDESNSSTVYEGYYIIRGAMSIIPVYDSKYGDYNLTLYFNYFPWRGEMYLDGNSSLLAEHVTQFKFKEDGGMLRIYLCITSPEIDLGEYNLTICKEKVVF